jgi:predicted RecA/RadA family phage recombinase
MNAHEIKQAINNGKKVYWSSKAYQVIKDKNNEYFIKCTLNEHCIGLTWADNTTLNGKEEDFFISNN